MKKTDRKIIENKRGVKNMSATINIYKDEEAYLKEMKKYLTQIQKSKKEIARIDAKKALIKSGVVTSKGKAKTKIVSWE